MARVFLLYTCGRLVGMSDYCCLNNRLIEKKGCPLWFDFLSPVARRRAESVLFLRAEVNFGPYGLRSLAGGFRPYQVLNAQGSKLLLL